MGDGTMPGDRLGQVLEELEQMNPTELATVLEEVQALLKNEGRKVWCTHKEVLQHLGVHSRTLTRAMAATPAHIQRPWVDMGSGSKPHYRWDSRRIDRWWSEVCEWRSSRNGRQVTGCGGEIRGVVKGAGRPQLSKVPARSNASPRKPQHKGSGGSLGDLLKVLTSKKS